MKLYMMYQRFSHRPIRKGRKYKIFMIEEYLNQFSKENGYNTTVITTSLQCPYKLMW
jgi:hypothetical protein